MYEILSKPLNVEKEIKLYSGTGNPELARRIAQILHLELSGLTLEKFANGETYAKFDESIRGDEVFIIQSIAGSNINDLLMEMLVAGDAAKTADGRTLLIAQLLDIQKRAAKAKSSDAATQAHWQALARQIETALKELK